MLSTRRAVNLLLTSVVREICALCSGGTGERATALATQWAISNGRPYRDSYPETRVLYRMRPVVIGR